MPVSASDFGPYSRIVKLNAPLRCGKPVSLFVCPRTLVLEVKVERAVRIIFKWHPTANRKAIEAVCNLKAVTVVERERPKGIYWRCSAFVEVDGVLARTVKRLAGFVGEVDRIDRIFR